jgi:RimJ/RimL family protein N-acetyltransferase
LPTIITPFDPEHLEDLWSWLQQYPLANFDDYGPKDYKAFSLEMCGRWRVTDEDGTAIGFCDACAYYRPAERSWGILDSSSELCGCIGFLPFTPRSGTFHGIVFGKGRLTHDEKIAAVREILAELRAAGLERIEASFFAHNLKIARFLSELGFEHEGTKVSHTLQDGMPVDFTMMAKTQW